MKQVRLSDWTQFSTRIASKSFRSKDGKWMLKTVDTNDAPILEQLKIEYSIAQIANKLGVPTPKVGDMVLADNGETGIIYEYIDGKKSFTRAISEDPENIESYMRSFAAVVRDFHSKDADTDLLVPFETRIDRGLKATKIFTESEKDIIREKLEKLPKMQKCLHGDMQPSNAITSPQGDFIIDLGLMSYGNPLFDIGFFYNMCKHSSDELAQFLFHMSAETLNNCWKYYAQYYFGTNGSEKELAEVDEIVKPFAKIGCLVVLPLVPDAETIANAKPFILSD